MSLSVLLVEDVAAQATVIESFLQVGIPGVEVSHRENLSSAVELLGKSSFDIILLDLGLPDADGLEVVFQVRDASGDTPIVVLTAQGEDGLGEMCIQSGAQDFLSKHDLEPDGLARTVNYAAMRRSESVILVLNQVLEQFRCFGETPESEDIKAFAESYIEFMKGTDELLSSKHEAFVSDLIEAGASPREVVSFHSRCLKALCRDANEREKNNYLTNSSSWILATMTLMAEQFRNN